METETLIDAATFAERLAVLCGKNRLATLPRRHDDQLIVLRSITLALDPQATYRERQVNETIQQWILSVGSRGSWDHVTLRRALVDEGLLVRDRAGSTYRLVPPEDLPFAPDVAAVDPVAVLSAAAQARRERDARYRAN
jgi:hypothetical protein